MHEVQECESTTRVQLRVWHSDAKHFVINLHGLHNAQLVRQARPDHLYAQQVQSVDRQKVFLLAVDKMKAGKQDKAKLATARKEAKAIIANALKDPSEGFANGDGHPSEVAPGAGTEGVLFQQTKRKADGSTSSRATKKSKVHKNITLITCMRPS